LRKGGRVVRLQEQPFQVLLALLERAGEVITREDLRERLWPGDSFGEFDQGLNTAINKLREALGDSAANPSFVETLPKRGYRFVHAIEADTLAPKEPSVKDVPAPRRYRNYIAVFLALAACLGAVFWMRRPAPDHQLPLRHFTFRFPVPISATPDMHLIAVSPNGRHIAMIDGERKNTIWIQDLDRQNPRMLEGTEDTSAVFWSPDSLMIGFVAESIKLKKVSVKGGPAILLCESPPYISGGAWNPNGSSIVFASGVPSSLHIVPENGGASTLLVSPTMLTRELEEQSPASGRRSGWLSNPRFLPDGNGPQKLLFASLGPMVGFGDAVLVVRDMTTALHQVIGPGNNAAYSPSGHLVYRAGNDLWARPFSVKGVRFEGETFRIARAATDPSVASDGTLVYRDSAGLQLVWLSRGGLRNGTVGKPAEAIYYPALSPDGRSVAIEVLDSESFDVWVVNVQRGARIRLSSHPSTEILPTWSPGGDRVAYGSYRMGNIDILVRNADAGGEEASLTTGPLNERVSDWSRDGKFILYTSLHPKTGSDLWRLQRAPSGHWEPHALLATPAQELAPKLSPDGRYVAYISDESGRHEVYVSEFVPGGRKWPVSTNGGTQIRWRRDGRELFFVEAGTLVAVEVTTAGGFNAGPPSRLFSHPAFTGWADANYDVAADGQRIIAPERAGNPQLMMHVVQNWFAEFGVRQ
jgi:Tol biopolymer transport system component/DNA-binding winged helix-turn-helix (wHTH) protein